MSGVQKVVVLVCGFFFPACFLQGTITTPFPEGLEPLEDVSAPAPGTEGEYPEDFSVVTGKSDEGYIWAHMRAYVHAPPAAVWMALQDPEVVADRRNTDERTALFDIEAQYEYSFQISYVVNDLLTVKWDEVWRFGAIEGSFIEPEFGMVRFQKTHGSDFIDLIEGMITVTPVGDGISELGWVEHVDALQESQTQTAGYAADLFASVVATVNEEPLPEY